MIYKDSNNDLHDDMDGTAISLLPAGSVLITQEEANAIIASKVVPRTYQELRKAAYPPIGDQLDAMWKGGEAEATMLSTILAVKAEYLKP